VRAVAIVAVLLFHAHYGWAAGGYLGVDVFFVLSGYLITGVLLSTHRSWWGYRDFLVRRAVRLLPALLAALAGAGLVVALIGTPRERSLLGPCTGASLGYVMNLPFAESLGCPAMWHVTWSLASEQQFYLLWPLLLAGLALAAPRALRPIAGRLGVAASSDARRVRLLVAAALGTAGLWLLAVGWHAALLAAGATTSRIAFAPDGRSLVLLLGCALALVSAGRPLRRTAPRGRRADATAAAAVLVLVGCFLRGGMGSGVAALVPMVVAGLASVALVRAASAPGPLTSRVLGARPVAWLGRASYSLYLWHEVAYRLAEVVAPRGSLTAEVLRFGLALVLAAASHRWVEQPVQRWWRGRGELSGSGSAGAATARTPSSRSRRPRPSSLRPGATRRSTPAAHR
jgi:peptidoglycan/LPS O-acetylase OafA/YrhL